MAVLAAISLGCQLSKLLKTGNPIETDGDADPMIAHAVMSLIALVVGGLLITMAAHVGAFVLLFLSLVLSNWKFERHSSLD